MTSRPVQLANRGATGINLAFLARSRVPSVCPRPQFGRPVLCPGLISNLNFEISNPPRPFSLLPLAFRLSEVSRVTIGSSARRYRVTSSTPAPPPTCCLTTRHSHLTLVFSQISNLKFQIPFGLSHDPSLIPQYPSVIPEYPPLSRNIPPYPRISLLSFSIATNSSTATSVSPLDLLQNRHPDNQPLAHETIMTSHEPDRPSAARQVSSFSASV